MNAAAANRRRIALGANGSGAGKLWRREPRPPQGIRPERTRPQRSVDCTRYDLPPEAEVRERASYIARCIGFTLDELREPSRTPRRVAARLFIALKLRDLGASYPQIGRALNRDHSTLIQGLQKRAALISSASGPSGETG